MSALDWDVLIDFDRDGTFTSIKDRVLGTIKWAYGFKPYTHVYTEQPVIITVNNSDRAFSPEYTGGAYYGSLKTGRILKIMFSTEIMYMGICTDFDPSPLRYGDQTARIKVEGLKRLLDAAAIYPVLQEGVRADEVLYAYVLSGGVPPTTSGIFILDNPIYGVLDSAIAVLVGTEQVIDAEVGVLTFNYLNDNIQGVTKNPNLYGYSDPLRSNTNKTTADKLIKDIVEAERGYLWMDADGKFYFKNRYFLIDNTTLAETVDNNAQGLEYTTPYSEFYNEIRVKYYPRRESATTNEVLWELDSPITIMAGATYNFEAVYTDEVGAKDVQTPSGADFVVSAGSATINVSSAAQKSEITLTNTGIIDVVIDTIVLRGRTVNSSNFALVNAIDLDLAFDLYVTKTLELDLRAIDNFVDAQEIAQLELRRRRATQGRISQVIWKSVPTATTNRQITRQIGDRINIQDYQTAHNDDYHITRISHTLDTKHKELTTVWEVQRATLSRIAGLLVSDYDTDYNLQQDNNVVIWNGFGQSFDNPTATTCELVRVYLRRVGSPTGTLTLNLYDTRNIDADPIILDTSLLDSNDVLVGSNANPYPDETLPLASATYSAASLLPSYSFIEFELNTPVSMTANTKYWWVLSTSDSASSSNYVQIGVDAGAGYTGGEFKTRYQETWYTTDYDSIFEVYKDA